MDFKRGKRGVSQIVTQVLIIAIVISLVGIIAIVIFNFVNNSDDVLPLNACGLAMTLSLDKSYVYVYNDGGAVIKVSRGTGGSSCELAGIRTTFNSYSGALFTKEVSPVGENQYQLYSFVGENNLITNGFSGSVDGSGAKLRSIDIVPIVKYKGENKLLDTKDTISFTHDSWCSTHCGDWNVLGFKCNVCSSCPGCIPPTQACWGPEDCTTVPGYCKCGPSGYCIYKDYCVTTPTAVCGNGIKEGTEECDGGSTNSVSHCNSPTICNCAGGYAPATVGDLNRCLPISNSCGTLTGCPDGQSRGDLNNDHVIDANDVCLLRDLLAGVIALPEPANICCADADSSGTLGDPADTDFLSSHLGQNLGFCGTSPPTQCGNGVIDSGEVCDDGVLNYLFGGCNNFCTACENGYSVNAEHKCINDNPTPAVKFVFGLKNVSGVVGGTSQSLLSITPLNATGWITNALIQDLNLGLVYNLSRFDVSSIISGYPYIANCNLVNSGVSSKSIRCLDLIEGFNLEGKTDLASLSLNLLSVGNDRFFMNNSLSYVQNKTPLGSLGVVYRAPTNISLVGGGVNVTSTAGPCSNSCSAVGQRRCDPNDVFKQKYQLCSLDASTGCLFWSNSQNCAVSQPKCNPFNANCVQCLTDSDCPSGQVCNLTSLICQARAPSVHYCRIVKNSGLSASCNPDEFLVVGGFNQKSCSSNCPDHIISSTFDDSLDDIYNGNTGTLYGGVLTNVWKVEFDNGKSQNVDTYAICCNQFNHESTFGSLSTSYDPGVCVQWDDETGDCTQMASTDVFKKVSYVNPYYYSYLFTSPSSYPSNANYILGAGFSLSNSVSFQKMSTIPLSQPLTIYDGDGYDPLTFPQPFNTGDYYYASYEPSDYFVTSSPQISASSLGSHPSIGPYPSISVRTVENRVVNPVTEIYANCSAGEYVIGGGFELNSRGTYLSVFMPMNYSDGKQGWYCKSQNPNDLLSCSARCYRRTCLTSSACAGHCGSFDDGCGNIITCTTPCPSGQTCVDLRDHTCYVCQPSCAGKQCGDNGCGGSCGNCNTAGGYKCSNNQCVSNCPSKDFRANYSYIDMSCDAGCKIKEVAATGGATCRANYPSSSNIQVKGVEYSNTVLRLLGLTSFSGEKANLRKGSGWFDAHIYDSSTSYCERRSTTSSFTTITPSLDPFFSFSTYNCASGTGCIVRCEFASLESMTYDQTVGGRTRMSPGTGWGDGTTPFGPNNDVRVWFTDSPYNVNCAIGSAWRDNVARVGCVPISSTPTV